MVWEIKKIQELLDKIEKLKKRNKKLNKENEKLKMKTKILQSNCSETAFRLTGTLQDIKNEVLKMLDIWENDEVGNSTYKTSKKEELTELRKRINDIKDLEEFEILQFDFTTNYETYFKGDGEDLLVASCNNHDWDNVNSEFMDSEEYYNIREGGKYHIAFEDDKYVLAQKKDDSEDNKKVTDTICIDLKEKIKLDIETNEYAIEDDEPKYSFRMFERKGKHFIKDDTTNKITEIEEVKDDKIIKQIETLIELNKN